MNYQINSNLPGILSLLDYNPESGKILGELAEKVLRDDQFSQIDIGVREVLAASVSRWNGCTFCFTSHYLIAIHHLGKETAARYILGEFKEEEEETKVNGYWKLARMVNSEKGAIDKDDVNKVKSDHGLNDREVHDVILITSMFNMYNMYVKASGVDKPSLNEGEYERLAQMVVEEGYAD